MELTEIIGLIMTALMIIAILSAPLFALRISVRLDKDQQLKDRRLWVFKILMSTRANRMSPDHVRALNMIDLEFHGDDADLKAVVEAWEQYKAHLADVPRSDPEDKVALDLWVVRKDDLFISLLHVMSTCLGYDYDISSLKRTSYFPDGHSQMELEQDIIRKMLTLILSGKESIPIRLTSTDSDKKQKEFRKMLEEYLTVKNPIKVIIMKDDDEQMSYLTSK